MKTRAEDWIKCRGTATVTLLNIDYKDCEIHWYQCKNIGKKELKVKIWGDKIEG